MPPFNPTGVKIAKTFDWKFMPRLALKILVICVFLLYIIFGTTATFALYKKKMYSEQDIKSLYTVISTATESGNPMAVAIWLNARPLEETDKLVQMITPKSAVLDFSTFFEIFRRELRLGRPEEALFWLQLGRFRVRYDILRCGADPDKVKNIDQILNVMPSQTIDTLLEEHPEDLKKSLQQVLDFDAKYPAHDNPVRICKAIGILLPAAEDQWEGYRRVLRRSAEKFLKSSG
jgi:hypothetical protein